MTEYFTLSRGTWSTRREHEEGSFQHWTPSPPVTERPLIRGFRGRGRVDGRETAERGRSHEAHHGASGAALPASGCAACHRQKRRLRSTRPRRRSSGEHGSPGRGGPTPSGGSSAERSARTAQAARAIDTAAHRHVHRDETGRMVTRQRDVAGTQDPDRRRPTGEHLQVTLDATSPPPAHCHWAHFTRTEPPSEQHGGHQRQHHERHRQRQGSHSLRTLGTASAMTLRIRPPPDEQGSRHQRGDRDPGTGPPGLS